MSLRYDIAAIDRRCARPRDRGRHARRSRPAPELPPIGIERPAKPEHGDWASNVAMQLAPAARSAPMRIAQAIRRVTSNHHRPSPTSRSPRPGFLNFRVAPGWIAAQVGPIRDAGRAYGRGTVSEPRRINVEFVSANPTGPLHVGNARGAFVGDVLSRVLEAAVATRSSREYYFNDFGTQVINLGLSVLARRRDTELPEDGYRGAYVDDLAAEVPDERPRAGRCVRPMTPAESWGGGHGAGARRDRGQPGPPRRPLRRLEGGGLAPPTAAGSSGPSTRLRDQRTRLRVRRRDVVPLDRLRRRQGPRDLPLERAADLLRLGHRLRDREVRAAASTS